MCRRRATRRQYRTLQDVWRYTGPGRSRTRREGTHDGRYRATQPALRALEQALTSGQPGAIEAFWREIAATGAPLVEPLDAQPGQALVTFLWRAAEPVERVVVVGGLAAFDFANHQMAHLPGTDLWYKTYQTRADLYTTYWLSPNDPLVPAEQVTDWASRTVTFQPDPLNRATFQWGQPTKSVVALADAPRQPWARPRPDVPRGTMQRHVVSSRVLGNERPVWLYTPPQRAETGAPPALLVHFDGRPYAEALATATILDNLQADGALPPLVALLPGTIDGPTRTHELSCYSPFIEFLTGELLPWARELHPVTDDPARTVVAGSSLGGLAAAFAALRRPDVFGNVLAQSGSFYWTPPDEPEYAWLTRQFVAPARLPLRFYLSAGLLEYDARGANAPSLTLSNRQFRDILRAKGYPVHYTEFNGGHDALWWQALLPEGLLALLGTGNAPNSA